MSSEKGKAINWNEVIGEEALGESGLDLGTIKEVTDDYIVTEAGMLNKRIYHLPKSSAKYFNGVFLNFSLNESDLTTYEQKDKESILNSNSFSESSDKLTKEETSIPLISEDLQVAKSITEDSIKIRKEPSKETKTVQIELVHEKVTIQKRPIARSDNKSDSTYLSKPESSSLDSKTEFRIPIKREEPVVTKKSFVREEVIVKKRPITETREVTKEVTSEKVNVADNIV